MGVRTDGRRRKLSSREEQRIARSFQACQELVARATALGVPLQIDAAEHGPRLRYVPLHGTPVHQMARHLDVTPQAVWRACRYVALVQAYPALGPPGCGMWRAIWIGALVESLPVEAREAAIAELLAFPQRVVQLRYAKRRRRRRVRETPLAKLPGPKLRRISGAIWHERLAWVRQHLQQLNTQGLVERLAETWRPDVQQGYRRELQQLIEELTLLDHRIASVSEPPHPEEGQP